ncbi:MAG: hypothetical protein AAFY41_10825, partial [Bacteroidota bacterium]
MRNIVSLFLIVFFVANAVNAQVRRNTVEASQNQQALAANEAQLERDQKELVAFKAKLHQLKTAFEKKDPIAAAKVKEELLVAMQREIQQSENKIAQDKQEVKQSQSEIASSNRDLRRSRVDGATDPNSRDDRRDRRDDQRD